MAGRPGNKLYPLVRDAITAAFRLDLRFILIDCYCILQDDEEDWEKAAANMASIDAHAFLTLSATSSVNGRSMFSTTPPDFREMQIAEIDGAVILVRKQLRHPCETTYLGKEIVPGFSRNGFYPTDLSTSQRIKYSGNVGKALGVNVGQEKGTGHDGGPILPWRFETRNGRILLHNTTIHNYHSRRTGCPRSLG
jgi:hypothetical protein